MCVACCLLVDARCAQRVGWCLLHAVCCLLIVVCVECCFLHVVVVCRGVFVVLVCC